MYVILCLLARFQADGLLCVFIVKSQLWAREKARLSESTRPLRRISDRQPSEPIHAIRTSGNTHAKCFDKSQSVRVSSASNFNAHRDQKPGVQRHNRIIIQTYQGAVEAWDQLCCSFHAEAAVRQPAFWRQNSREWLLADEYFTFGVTKNTSI
jgi:hypothetical protein